jgi:hypothetical protein
VETSRNCRPADTATPCATPAFVQITGEDTESLKTTVVRVPIPEDVRAQLNAKLNK